MLGSVESFFVGAKMAHRLFQEDPKQLWWNNLARQGGIRQGSPRQSDTKQGDTKKASNLSTAQATAKDLEFIYVDAFL